MDEHESILLIKQEVFVYKIPPAQSNRKHRYGNGIWSMNKNKNKKRHDANFDEITREISVIDWLNVIFTYRAANWNLSEPLWTGRMKLIAKGTQVNLKLEDKNTGALYANCPVETYPGNHQPWIYVLTLLTVIQRWFVRWYFIEWMQPTLYIYVCVCVMMTFKILYSFHIEFRTEISFI